MRLYRSQQSSLGIVAVYNDGDTFSYQVYKGLRPEKDEVSAFVDDRMDCYRFFIHARLATHGEVTVENAHPLQITDDSVDIEYLLHNGVVFNHETLREVHESNGHEYNTDVDSEAIAHEYGEVPDNVDECAEVNAFPRQGGFVLFGDERILIFTNGKYDLTRSAVMANRNRTFGPNPSADTYNYLLIPATNNA